MYAQLAETWVMLAIAAAATKQIKLGTGILLLAQHNVIETARAAATLDLYSGGRLILGVGAGWFREEAEVMGVRFEQRWKHLRESVEALRNSADQADGARVRSRSRATAVPPERIPRIVRAEQRPMISSQTLRISAFYLCFESRCCRDGSRHKTFRRQNVFWG
ncbi:MAG TPA: LLM class flavin-dependent oxidoreductase [Candidatus Binataceae bacterium]|nr:LLM class flavin-dependent oxidoreductase [Candidatus Binataceae bacterium]